MSSYCSSSPTSSAPRARAIIAFRFEKRIGRSSSRRLIGDVHHTTPLAIGLEAPDRVPTKVKRDRLTLRPRHSHLVGAAHVGKLPVRRKRRLLRHPMNLEAGRLETLGDIFPNRRFALDRRLARLQHHSIVAPV